MWVKHSKDQMHSVPGNLDRHTLTFRLFCFKFCFIRSLVACFPVLFILQTLESSLTANYQAVYCAFSLTSMRLNGLMCLMSNRVFFPHSRRFYGNHKSPKHRHIRGKWCRRGQPSYDHPDTGGPDSSPEAPRGSDSPVTIFDYPGHYCSPPYLQNPISDQ